jgi:hypothetical protein
VVKDDLKNLPPDAFASLHVFEKVPHVFGSDLPAYVTWKTELGAALEVDPRAISIVGSAGVGVSLNPTKEFSAFGPKSDIDVAIVSHHHFEAAWRYLRHVRAGRLTLSTETRKELRKHGKGYVFDGTIATESILAHLPFGKKWLTALNDRSLVAPTVGHEVKARIYRDFDCLRDYQLRGIRDAQSKV